MQPASGPKGLPSPKTSWFGAAWAAPLALLFVIAVAWFALLLGLEYLISFDGQTSFWTAMAYHSTADLQAALGNLPEVVVAILGITITVVSIILQLSATRYTPRVTEMFFQDRINLTVWGFFVLASLHCVVTTFLGRSHFQFPIFTYTTMALIVIALLILMPYFAYVFWFLDPERVVTRLQRRALSEALDRKTTAIPARQRRVLKAIEQLADIGINAVSNKDRIIASRTTDRLKELAFRYIPEKSHLPESWFAIGEVLGRNPDFEVMAAASVEELSASHSWLEWKVLRQYQTLFHEALNKMREISQLVAIGTRYIGEAALAAHDDATLKLSVRFFNTYLRAAINQRDVRSGYNALHQYRQLAEAMLRAGRGDQVLEVAAHLRYYGRTANAEQLPFLTETAAYDLSTLCELARTEQFDQELALLEILLGVDKIPESEAEERSLRGVRKAQIKLASFYLLQGEERLARKVWQDMRNEPRARLTNIKDELLTVNEAQFWEIVDRGSNFEYLEPARKEQVAVFYRWFDQPAA